MAGWRVAFLSGNAEVVQALVKLKTYLDYGTFQPIQIAATVTMNEAPDYPREVCATYESRRDALCDGLARIGWEIPKPGGTMFVWAPIPEPYQELDSLEFASLLIRDCEVATSPGVGLRAGRRRLRAVRADRERAAHRPGRPQPPPRAHEAARACQACRGRARFILPSSSRDRVSVPCAPMAIYVVRVWLPDRPGALGQVASRIGARARRRDRHRDPRARRRAGPSTSSSSACPTDERLELLDHRDRPGRRRRRRGRARGGRRAPGPAGGGAGHRRADGRGRRRRRRARRACARSWRDALDCDWAAVLALDAAGDPMLDRPGAVGGLAGRVPAGSSHLESSDDEGNAPPDLVWAALARQRPRAGGRPAAPAFHSRERRQAAALARVADGLAARSARPDCHRRAGSSALTAGQVTDVGSLSGPSARERSTARSHSRVDEVGQRRGRPAGVNGRSSCHSAGHVVERAPHALGQAGEVGGAERRRLLDAWPADRHLQLVGLELQQQVRSRRRHRRPAGSCTGVPEAAAMASTASRTW